MDRNGKVREKSAFLRMVRESQRILVRAITKITVYNLINDF